MLNLIVDLNYWIWNLLAFSLGVSLLTFFGISAVITLVTLIAYFVRR